MSHPETLLTVKNLSVHYPSRLGWFWQKNEPKRAVNDISFTVSRGKTVGLVGESGSGKSTTGKAIIKLSPLTSGQIFYEETNIGVLDGQAFQPWRKKIQMIFQDPYNSLNPRSDVQSILSEPLEIHFPNLTASEREERCVDLLKSVKLPADYLRRYPHEFSGGQRQRIGIARALAVQPELIICDEPVSALDVSVQAEVVNLLQDLQEQLGLTYLFIAHDLAVIEQVSDEILVMSQGKIVEAGKPSSILSRPQHPYTQKLLSAVPRF